MENEITAPETTFVKKPLLPAWLRALLFLIVFLIATVVSQIVMGAILDSNFTNPNFQWSFEQEMLIYFSDMPAILLALALFMYYLDKLPFIDLGFRLKGHIPDILWGLAMGTAIMLGGFIVLLIMNQITVSSIDFNFYRLFLFLLLLIKVAFFEEMIMRGYLLRNLMQVFNKYIALALSAVVFSALHALNPNYNWFSFLQLTMAGVVLGLSYIYTKNLWFPIALHFAWNFVQGPVLGFAVSGTQSYSILTQQRAADTIWNGGEFGFEGSILCLLFMFGLIVWIWKKFGTSEQGTASTT